MPLYARSDLMSVSIPKPQGCGATHMRPVTRGAPAKVWKLECPECTSHLRGDRRDKVIRNIHGDKELNIPSRMEHIPDADPQWSNTPEGVPLTPDEQHVNKIRAERGNQQLQQLQALAALRSAGLQLPPEAMWLLESNFDSRIIKGSMICADGHENPAGTKFCGECGMSMDALASIAPPPEETDPEEPAEIPLDMLHIATLKKRAREAGYSDKGTKQQLIARLSV